MINYRSIQKLDFFRNLFTGSILPILEVILMLVFIKSFSASTGEKTALIVVIKTSYLLGIFISLIVFRKHLSINYVVSIICFLSGFSLLFLAYVEVIWVFLILSVLVALPLSGMHGLLSEFYNYYPREIRGKLYVTSNLGLFVGGVFFSILYDYIIEVYQVKGDTVSKSLSILQKGTSVIGEGNNINYAPILLVAALFIILSAGISWFLPKITFTGLEKASLKNWFKILGNDKMFTYVLTAWFFLGVANLWIVSYRTNLLVEENFGFNYDESTVLLLVVLVPQVIYLLFNYPFAWFFDRYNIIVLRIVININMGLYIGFFFMSSSFYGQLTGAFFYGVFTSGGNLAWKLWVHKVVPKDKVSTYMNIHTAFTGFRMVVAPVFGLIGLYSLGPVNAAWISLTLLSISTVMMFFLIPIAKKKFIY